MKWKWNEKDGFTIAEVVITTILILLMSIPLARISFSSVRNTQFALQATEALALGQKKLEEFYYEANAYSSAILSTNSAFNLETVAYNAIASGTETDGAYTLTWTVNTANQTWGSTTGACKIVDLEVKWNIGSSSKDSKVELTATYTEPAGSGAAVVDI